MTFGISGHTLRNYILGKLLLLGLVLAGTTSYAQNDSYGYVGLEVGIIDYSVDLFNRGFPFTISDTTNATELYGGWKVNEHLAFEGSYGQSGDLRWSGTIIADNSDGVFGPSQRVSADAAARTDFTVITLSLLGYINWFFAGAGLYETERSFDFDVACPCAPNIVSTTTAVSDSDMFFTLGAEWDLERWAIRGQYRFFDSEGTVNIDTISVGANFKF